MRKAGTLDDLGEIVDNDAVLRTVSDLSGAPVEDSTGIHVGAIFGTLVEADTGLLRYIDLALEMLNRHVLVPIGHARVREVTRDAPSVRLRAALLEELEQIPPFPADVGHVTDPFERALLEAYGRTFHGERYYAHPAYDHGGLYIGEHPVIGPHDDVPALLTPMTQLTGWQVGAGESDIRGWPVRLAGGSWHVLDLIVDTTAEKVRYVALSPGQRNEARLLPVGYLRIDRQAGEVEAAGLNVDDVLATPHYAGGTVSRAHEDELGRALRSRLTGRRRYLLADYRPG